jgi:hypothetical protein
VETEEGMTDEMIRALLDNATPGRRVQFHPSYCAEAAGSPFSEWDTSHDMSVIRPDGSRYRLANYRHADDAALSQAAPELAAEVLRLRAQIATARAQALEAAAQKLTRRANQFPPDSPGDGHNLNAAFIVRSMITDPTP